MIVERSMHPDWLSNAYLIADAPGGIAVFVERSLRRAVEHPARDVARP